MFMNGHIEDCTYFKGTVLSVQILKEQQNLKIHHLLTNMPS